jgi:hypothetical protein
VLFQPFTVVKKDSVATIQKILDKVQVPGFPLPNADSTIEDNSQEGMRYFDEIGASNMYNKKIGRVDYRITPSNLNKQNNFWWNEKLRTRLLSYPFLYRVDTAIYIGDTANIKVENKKIVLLNDRTLIGLINKNQPNLKTDSVTITAFSPNRWDIDLKCSQPSFYSVFQNYYSRLGLLVDGRKAAIENCNVAFTGFFVPAGKHHISFYYKATDIKIAFWISLAGTVIILGLAILPLFRSNKKMATTSSLSLHG